MQNPKKRWGKLRHKLTWEKYRRFLSATLQDFRIYTVVSENERELAKLMIKDSARIELIPNCVDLSLYDEIIETPAPNSLIFAGSFTYPPNYYAMNWFLRTVYPRVKEEVPEVSPMEEGN